MKNAARLLLVVAALLILPVYAATPGAANVDATESKGNYTYTPTTQTIDIVSGNIYVANVSTEMSTYHWAGIYGNATGKLVLGDSSGAKMFEWTAKATYVFFDDDSTVDWTNIGAATCTDIGGSFSFVDDSTDASDACSNTFTTTGNTQFKSISTVSGTALATTNDNSGAHWKTFAVKDSTDGDVLFAAETEYITSGGTAQYHAAYNGETANYQVILPEDGDNGDTTATTYYVWIELY